MYQNKYNSSFILFCSSEIQSWPIKMISYPFINVSKKKTLAQNSNKPEAFIKRPLIFMPGYCVISLLNHKESVEKSVEMHSHTHFWSII